MKRISVIFLSTIALVTLITGCSTTSQKQEPLVIYNTKLKPIPIPAYLLENCPIPLPPNKDTYVKLTPEQKEEYLANYTIELHKNITKCNNTIDSTRDWNQKQLQIFKDVDKK
jgi:hypothetical protein